MIYDTINFICDAVENEYYGSVESDYLTKNHRDLKITVVLNGVRIGWNQAVCPYSLTLHHMDHKSSWAGSNWSVFRPFTCSCGDSGCAGIWDGIYVRPRKHSVEWRAKREDGYGFLGKTFFSFERKAYEKAFKDMLNDVLAMCSRYPDEIVVVDAGYCKEQMVTAIDFYDYVQEQIK